VSALAVVSCASDPTGDLSGGVAGVEASFSFLQVTVGDSVAVIAQTRDAQGNALTTLPDVASLDPSIAAVVVADQAPLAQRRFFVRGVAFGQTQVVVTSGGHEDTVDIQTWPDVIDIRGVNALLRSGDVATASLVGVDAAGGDVAGVTPMRVVTDDSTVLAVDPVTNAVTARNSGIAILTATGPVNSAGDTVARGTLAVKVVANVPAIAALSDTTFGAVGAGESKTLELVVLDANGNQNMDSSEVLSASLSVSDPGVASIAVAVEDTAQNGTERHIFVTVTGIAAGTVNVTGTVTTTAGALSVGTTPATVLFPQITASAPASAPGATLVIAGTGLASPGFETLVLVDGAVAGNITSATANAVTVQMPTLVPGTYDLEITVGGVISNTDAWTQVGAFAEAGTEPNDDTGQEAPISSSFAFSGTADQATDFSDLFQFTVTGDDFVLDLELAWGDGNDLDVLIYPIGAQVPGTYSEDTCGFGLSSLANPESGSCELGAAGVYTLEILHYGAGPTTYTVKGTIRPR
jgi:hypothetical protein